MKDGEYIEYYDAGKISHKCWYLDGKPHGVYINYDESGEISSKCNFIGGKLHGECISYYESGNIPSKSYYINDNLVTELEWIRYIRNIKLELLGL